MNKWTSIWAKAASDIMNERILAGAWKNLDINYPVDGKIAAARRLRRNAVRKPLKSLTTYRLQNSNR
jgi:hypothetical protein